MTRFRVSAVALVLVATGFAPDVRAAQAPVVLCEPAGPPGSAAVEGSGTWSPEVTHDSAAHTWSMSLLADCRQGTGHDSGVYRLNLDGRSEESCEVGTGWGTVTGTGPSGPVSGTVYLYKFGIHYFLNATVISGGHTHGFDLWVDVLPLPFQQACPYDRVELFGHGAIYPVRDIQCSFYTVRQADITGENYEGVAWGYISYPGGGHVEISCYIEVNGVEVAATPVGEGEHLAVTAGQVTFQADDEDIVDICARGEADMRPYDICDFSEPLGPPQVVDDVADLLDTVFIDYVDPTLCALLGTQDGTYGPVVIDGGDVILAGEPPLYDCPPYGW